MGASHFSAVDGGLSIGSQVIVEPTGGLGVSPAGGSFVLGARTVESASGVWALFTNQVDFAPAPRGGAISALLRSGGVFGVAGAVAGAAPFLFGCAAPIPYDVEDPPSPLPNPDADSLAYIAGLRPEMGGARLVVVKGRLGDGLPSATVGELGVIARGSILHPFGTWVHVRLMAVANTTGDTAVQLQENDLALHAPSSPTWVPAAGTSIFVDDVLGAATGTPGLPVVVEGLSGSFFGKGAHHTEPRSVACFDRFAVERQA